MKVDYGTEQRKKEWPLSWRPGYSFILEAHSKLTILACLLQQLMWSEHKYWTLKVHKLS